MTSEITVADLVVFHELMQAENIALFKVRDDEYPRLVSWQASIKQALGPKISQSALIMNKSLDRLFKDATQ